MRTPRKILMLTAVALLAIVGCKDDDEDDQPNPSTDRTLSMSVEASWGPAAFQLGDMYFDDFGNVIRFTRIQMYMSNLEARDEMGNAVGSFPNALLFDASALSNNFSLGTVSEGDVHELVGYIGLDSITNHADPLMATAPLNDGPMHWNWLPAAGYKFAVIEGEVDTDGDGSVDTPFVYHLATDNLYTMFSMNPDADVDPGVTLDLHVEVDMKAAVNGVDIKNNLDTHTGNFPVLAGQLMGNLAGAIQVD